MTNIIRSTKTTQAGWTQQTTPVAVVVAAAGATQLIVARESRQALNIDNPMGSGVGNLYVSFDPLVAPTDTWPNYHFLIPEGRSVIIEKCEGACYAYSVTGGNVGISEMY